ncbi:hypothetical protein D3C75_1232980 [compost metagenome]
MEYSCIRTVVKGLVRGALLFVGSLAMIISLKTISFMMRRLVSGLHLGKVEIRRKVIVATGL